LGKLPDEIRVSTFTIFTIPLQFFDDLEGIDTDSLGDFEKLNNIKPSFTPLILGNEGLKPFKLLGKVNLAKVSLFPSRYDKLAEAVILFGENRFLGLRQGFVPPEA